jgi:hypothetical protein
VSALHERAIIAGKEHTLRGHLAPCRPKRGDTLIASVVLVLLLAGWLMNFVGPRRLSEGVGTFLAYSFQRQA